MERQDIARVQVEAREAAVATAPQLPSLFVGQTSDAVEFTLSAQPAQDVIVTPSGVGLTFDPPSLYFSPYYTLSRWLPQLELAGPFAGARPSPCKLGDDVLSSEARRLSGAALSYETRRQLSLVNALSLSALITCDSRSEIEREIHLSSVSKRISDNIIDISSD